MGSRSSVGRGNLEGGKYRDFAVSCAKTAEPIEMLFGMWTRLGPRKHVLDVGCTLAQPGEYN